MTAFWRKVLGYERRPVLLAAGDAQFASTGRGEVSVPVKGSLQLVKRLLKQMRDDAGTEGMLVKVDERRTTLCCHECEAVMEHKHDKHGKQVRDVMLCGSAKCRGSDHNPMPRDRDANAAKNILRIAEALALGQERPSYLVCRPRQKRRRA